ncbi:MAG: OPT family small oligopeptide transporter [Linnemannia gamsii]|nr:MAG: OPT family small oligopeptide transporter [Linnemannia gamsii]
MADVTMQKDGKADYTDMPVDLSHHEKALSIDSLDDAIENSPIEEVRASVPPTDDTTLPTGTFRAWFLGFFFTALLAFVNQFFWFRENPLTIRVMVAQLLAYPLGLLLARILPTNTFSLFGWKFSLNPGPFNIKEHVLITIMANSAATTLAAIDIIVIQQLYYNDSWGFGGGLLLVISTQFVGYGFAGALRRFLVRPAAMIWPVNLVNATLFHTLHRRNTGNGSLTTSGEEAKTSWTISRNMFFFIVATASFVYYWFPGYIFPLLTSISWVCWINRDSLLLNQLGSGLKGIGYGSFTLDWSSMSAWLPSPLAIPWWAQANMLAGFVFFVWILIPIMYYTDRYEGKKFPIYNTKTYDVDGKPYDLTRVLVDNALNEDMYNSYSPVRITAFFATMYGQGLCALGAIVSHAILYHGKDIWARVRSAKQKDEDIHARLMDAYPECPDWWYYVVFIVACGLSMLTVELYPSSDMTWWHVLVAMGLAAIWTLPIGILTAITSQAPSISMISEWVFGVISPGRPIGNMIFKTYGFITVQQAIAFTQDLKLGHYMKVPPRDMFIFQMVGTMVAAVIAMGTTTYMMENIDGICTEKAYPFTCPSASLFGASSVVWGVIGPLKFLSSSSLYYPIVWFFFIGFAIPLPFYLWTLKYPNSWVKDVNMAAFMLGGGPYPPAGTSIMPTWALTGFIFNFVIKRRHFGWWSKYNYVMSAALDAGVAIAALVIFFALQNNGIKMPTWWGNNPDSIDQCPRVTQNWAGHDTYAEKNN